MKNIFYFMAIMALLTACGSNDDKKEIYPSIMDGYYEGVINIDNAEYPLLINLSNGVFIAAYTPSSKLGHIPDHINCRSNFTYKSPEIILNNSGQIYNFLGNYNNDPETYYKMVECNNISEFIPLEYIYNATNEEITSKPDNEFSTYAKKTAYENLSSKSLSLLKSGNNF